MARLLALLTLFLYAGLAQAQTISVASFNVNSDPRTDPARVAEDLARVPPLHLWALQEVTDQATLDQFAQALSEATGFVYAGHLGQSGEEDGDRLAFVYIEEAFQDVTFRELEDISGAILPLAMTGTSWTGAELTFVNAHFSRSSDTIRRGQAQRLREWIEDHERENLIVLGQLNFDYDFRSNRPRGNRAFATFSQNGPASWPQPMCVANEACPVHISRCNPPNRDIQDFIFLAGQAKNWQAISDIAFANETYCGRANGAYSNYRPVMAQIALPGGQ